jgi:8-oxo-dGTP pyrophosphatase MutT (NUDIX family)
MKRAAVIPYIVMNEVSTSEADAEKQSVHFLLARDPSGDITDFGGGVKQNEEALRAALREFREESNEIFGDVVYENINDTVRCIVLIENQMAVIFLPVEKEWYYSAVNVFSQKRETRPIKKTHNEVVEVMWFTESEFKDLTRPQDRRMWDRIRKFYYNNYTDEVGEALKLVY